MTTTYESRTQFTLENGADFLRYWLSEFEEHDYNYSQPAPDRLEVREAYGNFSIALTQSTIDIELTCYRLSDLFDVRGSVIAHIKQFDPHLGDLNWTGETLEGQLPPSFKLARVISAEQLGASYTRMVVQGDDLDRFDEYGLHFRLVRQKDISRAAVWPRMAANGAAKWPEGEDELWSTVYTTRKFDRAAGQLTLDIFQHEGGIACEWAKNTPIDEIVGLMGPGGGWIPQDKNMLMAGDETAVPVLSRIVEEAAGDVRGKVFIQVAHEGDIQPLDAPTNLEVTWLVRGTGDDLGQIMRAQIEADQSYDKFWFAGHKSQARALRKYLKNELKIDKSRLAIAAYWQ